jgi:DNA-binding beta-propeller fold protein YncE
VSGGNISQYGIGAEGRLSPLSPPTVSVGGHAYSIAVSPDGKSAYVPSDGIGIYQFDVDPATGALSAKTPPAVPLPGPPTSLGNYHIAVTPDGRTAYADNPEPHGGDHLSQYDIDQSTGKLSLRDAEAGCIGGFVTGTFAVSLDGRSLYGSDIFVGAEQCDIDPATGSLSPKTPYIVSTNDRYPESVVLSPDGKSAYYANFNNGILGAPNNTIAQFDIDPASGRLSLKTPALITTGVSARVGAGAITPDGRSLYVISGGRAGSPPGTGSVWLYDIDPSTGALSHKDPADLDRGGYPEAIAVSADGRSAYVTNGGDNYLWQYDIDPTDGALSPKNPATVATDGLPGNLAVGPLPRVPTSQGECTRGGWRVFVQFKNQGQCVAFVVRRR